MIPKTLAELLFHTYNLVFLHKSPNSNDKENYLSSISDYKNNFFHVSWSEGGTHGSCWNDEIHESSGEEEPRMVQLINFVNSIKPSLIKSQQEYIFSKVNYKSVGDSDYYGGRTSEGHKNIDFDVLIGYLSSLDCYKDDELVDFDELKEEYSNFIIDCNLKDYYSVLSKRKLKKELTETLSLKDDVCSRVKI